MTDDTGRYGVVRNAFDFDVIDKQNENKRELTTKSRTRAHAEARRLNRAHRIATGTKAPA